MLIALIVLSLLTVAANVYFLMCIVAANRFFSQSPQTETKQLPPVTILIPAKGADFEACENLASFCNQDYPEFQIVCGVLDPRDSMIAVVEQINSTHNNRIELSIGGNIIGENLKVSNLQSILRHAKYEHILIVDSDIRVGTDYLRSIMKEFQSENVGLVTCLYRAGRAPDLSAKLEAIGITTEFAGGVLVARMLEGIKFALGATMVTTQSILRKIGGFPAIADYLADDFMLGNLIAAAGYEVRLSKYVVETILAPGNFAAMVRHQLRWGRSTRVSRPWGYLGMIMTYGTALACLNVIASFAHPLSLLLLGITLAIRLFLGWLIGIHYLNDRIAKSYWWLIPVRDLLSFAVWVMSMVGRNVEWRGQRFRLAKDGKLTPAL